MPRTHKRIEMKHLIAILLLALASIIPSYAQAAEEDAPKALRFAWGADLNSSVDLSQNDMTNIGIDAYFGISLPAVEMLGVGVGANVPVSNSRYSYPIFAILRTNFSSRPSLCFLDLRPGISINNRIDSRQQTGAYVSAGVGIQLASTRSFRSHLILGYTFTSQGDFTTTATDGSDLVLHAPDLHFATLRLGITF